MEGLTTAPLTPDDGPAVARVWRACEIHDNAFGVAWRAGLRHVGLATDSRTGARGLYEHVGMRVTRTSWEHAKLLR